MLLDTDEFCILFRKIAHKIIVKNWKSIVEEIGSHARITDDIVDRRAIAYYDFMSLYIIFIISCTY